MSATRIKFMVEPGLNQVALDRLRQLGGDQLVREMIDLFLEHTPKRIAAAVAGAQVGNWKAVEQAAHSVGSSAGHLGATAFKDAAARLEDAAVKNQGPQIATLLQELDDCYQQARGWLEQERKGLTA